MMGSGFSSDLVEEWMYTVEFDTGAHGSHGTLLLYDRQVSGKLSQGVNQYAKVKSVPSTKNF